MNGDVFEQVRRLHNEQRPVICEACGTGAPIWIYYAVDRRYLCDTCWQIAFRRDFGRWPGEIVEPPSLWSRMLQKVKRWWWCYGPGGRFPK